MASLLTAFRLDVEMAKGCLNKFQLILFKIKGMRIINVLESQIRKAGNKTTKEPFGFSAIAEGSDESCKEGYDKIMLMLTENKIDDEVKRILNHRDMRTFKNLFRKGVKKVIENQQSFLMTLNSFGIIADVKIQGEESVESISGEALGII